MSLFIVSCRNEEVLVDIETHVVTTPEYTEIDGFYLLNEGNMGNNKSTLDYFDYKEGTYYKNIYAERNPTVVKELGDVGNDLLIYGEKMYAVINCSHKVEVMNANDATRITKNRHPKLPVHRRQRRICLCEQLCRSCSNRSDGSKRCGV